jgi:hypothetical protein
VLAALEPRLIPPEISKTIRDARKQQNGRIVLFSSTSESGVRLEPPTGKSVVHYCYGFVHCLRLVPRFRAAFIAGPA